MTLPRSRSYTRRDTAWGPIVLATLTRYIATHPGPGGQSESIDAPDEPWASDRDSDLAAARHEDAQERQLRWFEA